jgi:pyridinium-3,5-biscarboxylic acid mononucleotide synthase
MDRPTSNSNSADSRRIEQLAEQLTRGELSLDNFLRQLAQPKTADLTEVQLDLDRRRRCGYPEAIFGEGKPLATLEKLIQRMIDEQIDVFATRITPETATAMMNKFPAARYNSLARTLRVPLPTSNVRNAVSVATENTDRPNIAIVTAGTTDLPVAEEARETLRWMGFEPTLVQDVGVAGPHRLPERLHQLEGAAAVVVVAGMEGALPSVVGGYVACPVIAVPTSVGYGASCGGLAALLSMLNSCAANVTVVNVDAGFKAGYVAGLIASRAARSA